MPTSQNEDIAIIDDDGTYAIFATNHRARSIAEGLLPQLKFNTDKDSPPWETMAVGKFCEECMQQFYDDLRKAGLVLMIEKRTPIKAIQSLVVWMRGEGDHFEDICNAYGNDPEQCEPVDAVEAALNRVEDWLEKVSPEYSRDSDHFKNAKPR
jgi:hypothetical protein